MTRFNGLRRVALMMVVACLLPNAAFAWGWWWVASVVVGGVVCVATGGVAAPIVLGVAAGVVGTAAKGDSVFDDIAAAASNPVGGLLMFQQANPAALVMPPVVDPLSPPQLVQAVNAAQQQFADSLRLARGIRESARRYFGAKLAGNTAAMQLQKGYVLQFTAAQAASEAGAVATYRNVANLMRAFIPATNNTRATLAEYMTFKNTCATSGLPSCVTSLSNQLLLTSQEQQGILSYIVNRPNAEVVAYFAAHAASGIYLPDFLDEAMNHLEAQPMVLAIAPEILAMTLTANQPFGPGSVRLTNTGGIYNADYLTVFSFNQANATSPGTGPWAGLHIAPQSILDQYALGAPPFVGQLDGTGASLFQLPPGSLPPQLAGLTVWGVTRTYDLLAPALTSQSNVAAFTF